MRKCSLLNNRWRQNLCVCVTENSTVKNVYEFQRLLFILGMTIGFWVSSWNAYLLKSSWQAEKTIFGNNK